MDFLFAKDRTPWVATDKKATKIGPIFDRDFENGEAFTAFDEMAVDNVLHLKSAGGGSLVVNSEGVEDSVSKRGG
jgi:hypothetical protein